MMSGWAGSGKDTTANYLVEHKGYVRMAFADALKDTISKTRNIPRDWMDTAEGKMRIVGQDGKTVRDYLIEDGQAARAKDPAVWIKVVIENIKKLNALRDGDCKIVISDWRLPNEYDLLKKEFGNVMRVRVNRFKQPPINDYTETALDKEKFDLQLDNTGTTRDFIRVLDALNLEWEELVK